MEISNELIDKLSKINLMEEMNISDTIVRYNVDTCAVFININTGTKSHNFYDCIREERRYILVELKGRNLKVRGYLSKYIPEYDILLSSFYVLNNMREDMFKWEELYKIAISRDNYITFNNDGYLLDKRNVKKQKASVPLCGMFIHPMDMNHPNAFSSIINLPGESAEEARKFCKGIFCDTLTFHYKYCLNHIMDAIDDNDVTEESFGIWEINMDGISVCKPPNIPSHIINELMKRAGWIFNYCIENKPYIMNYLFEGIQGSILQEFNGEYVLRTFIFYPDACVDSMGNMHINFVEKRRIHITDALLDNMEDICSPLLYFERNGIKDGIFKYVEKHLEWAEEQTLNEIRNKEDLITLETPKSGTLCFPYIMAFMPSFEKLYNMIYSNYEKEGSIDKIAEDMLDSMRKHANVCPCPAKRPIEWLIGSIDEEEKELHKIFGISKCMLKLISKARLTFDEVRIIKYFFYDNKEYLDLLNEKNTILLINFVRDTNNIIGEHEPYMSCLLLLMKLFGVSNFAGYISFLYKEYTDKNLIVEYSSYIKKLSVINDGMRNVSSSEVNKNGIVSSFEWKVKAKDLEKADNAINESYILFNDRENYQQAALNFKKLNKKWEQYEYDNGEFMVICPKSPTEVSEEGFRLKHCVKDFIDSIADGQTIIMFVRKRDNPNRPFYTLEIKDNYIRQCHGFDNCNIADYNGLMGFIVEYAINKKLVLSDCINKALGVD